MAGFTTLGSCIFSDTLADILNNTIAADWDTDTWNIALFDDSGTLSADTANAAYNVAPWDSGEVDMGTSPWAAGGVALTTIAAAGASGSVKIDANDVSVGSTTLSGAYGCLIYDTSVSDRALIAVSFGGSYSTSNGTFGITWDAAGIATIDVTP